MSLTAHHLYVHVPFCTRRCSYCDFSIAVRRTVPVDDYLEGIEAELRLRAPPGGWELDTLYFGGGTPSRLGPDGICRLTDLMRRFAVLKNDAEFTIEANPEDISAGDAERWLNAGINRLSVGVQSFDDRALEWMSRVHDGRQAREAIVAARSAGFENISLDLIFALPEQLGRDWSRDLEEAVALGPDHVSLYGLTVEPHAPLGKRSARGQTVSAEDERYASEFLEAHAFLCSSNYRHYEVSNFALGNALSRHNSSYWRGVAYEGIGPAAHAFDGAVRRWNAGPYAAWLRALREGADPVEGSERLDDKARELERVYLGLRTDEGVLLPGRHRDRVLGWEAQGWAVQSPVATGDCLHVSLTPQGWLRMDSLLSFDL